MSNLYRDALRVVGHIYEAAYNPKHWEVALEHLFKLLSAKSGGLFIQDMSLDSNNALYSYKMPKTVLMTYNLGLGRFDPGFRVMSQHPIGATEVFLGDGLSVSPMYEKFILHPLNIYHAVGLNIFKDDEWHVGLGVHRSKQAGPFSQDEKELISELTPHFQRALRIQKEFTRLRLQQNIRSAALSHISLGVVLLDHQGCASFINPIADHLLREHPAIRICGNDKIVVCDQQKDAEFQAALLSILTDDSNPPLDTSYTFGLRTDETSHPLAMLVTPHDASTATTEWPSSQNRGAVIYLSDPAAPALVSSELLKNSYGLTNAESKVAIGLTNGLSLEQIAESNNVSFNTVKSHLRSVFQKTGTSRQPELVSLLLALRI